MSLQGSIPAAELERLAEVAKENGVEAVQVAVFEGADVESTTQHAPWLSLDVTDGNAHYGDVVTAELAEKTT
jgi:hypothetical protein